MQPEVVQVYQKIGQSQALFAALKVTELCIHRLQGRLLCNTPASADLGVANSEVCVGKAGRSAEENRHRLDPADGRCGSAFLT